MTIIEQARELLASAEQSGMDEWYDADRFDVLHSADAAFIHTCSPQTVAALCRALIARTEALRECENVMTIVEPRSHKAEYLDALDAARRALAEDGREGRA